MGGEAVHSQGVCTRHGYVYPMSSVGQERVCCSGNQINILLWFKILPVVVDFKA